MPGPGPEGPHTLGESFSGGALEPHSWIPGSPGLAVAAQPPLPLAPYLSWSSQQPQQRRLGCSGNTGRARGWLNAAGARRPL